MFSFKEIISDEVFRCKLVVHKERFREKSFEGQPEEFGLIDTYALPTNEYLGSIPLWWNDMFLNKIIEIGETERRIHRITVSLHQPLIHIWTYEDYRKNRCDINKIGLQEKLQSMDVRVYHQISFLVREKIDNETHYWESRDIDIEEEFIRVLKWCYRPYKIND